ncbi:MAG TPA: NADH-quinone oxidoreductase subunit NuoH [Terriglobia bacterium]|nr:NADH-quinone oxidoreductase subunit NuoH [Terriglobia bacterium]
MINTATQFLLSHPLIFATIKILIVFNVMSAVLMYIVYMERKVLAFMQARLGPMRVGPWGVLQALADPIKLMLKEDIVPSGADRTLFLLAPVISVAAAFTVFSAIPFTSSFIISDINIGILFILAVSSLGIYGIILGGWASNSHYPLLGALRSAAQLVSYEVAGGMAIVGVLLISNSLSLRDIVVKQQQMGVWNVFIQPVGFFVYLVAAIAETNRSPFDLPEAESELTAGFHTEYSGFRFSLFFMAEYTAMILVSCIAVTLFWGGWLRPFSSYHRFDFLDYTPIAVLLAAAVAIVLGARKNQVPMEKLVLFGIAAAFVLLAFGLAVPVVTAAIQGIFWFSAKVFVFLYAFIWYRGTFPRYRYDQLMNLGWRVMIPLGLANVIATAVLSYVLTSHTASAAASMIMTR